jgi:hypothetical protein
MMRIGARATWGMLVLLFGGGYYMAQGRDYADPNGDFALRPPEGWQAARSPVTEAGWLTTFTRDSAHIAVVAFRSTQDMSPSMLEATGGALMEASLQEIQQHGTIYSKSIRKVSSDIPGASGAALRCDLEFNSEEAGGARLKGAMFALLGRRVAVLVAISAPLADAASYRAADSALKTLSIESRVPAGAGAPLKTMAPAGKPSQASPDLSRLAGKFKGNLARESRSTVLAAGNPPLTYGSVAAFAELVGECFNIQLTEGEFDATRQRFIEYYQKGDPEGKAVLAEGWGKLLQTIRSAQGEERAAMVEEVRAVMADRFSTGAQAGIGWAVTMNEAISKRAQSVGKTEADRPAFAKDKRFDSDFSQADLEASLEMLYFMWVASGRDASLVTADTVAQVQVDLVRGYPTYPPDLQYVLANAQQIYAGLRAQWENAGAGQRIKMAITFGLQLDALGFTVPRPRSNGGNGGSAWSNVNSQSHANFAGEMVVGLAGSSYKSAW